MARMAGVSVEASTQKHLPGGQSVQSVQLDDQLSLVKFLRHANAFKDEQIQTLQEELAHKDQIAEARLGEALDEQAAQLEEAQHIVTLRELDAQRMRGELRSYKALEPEIDALRQENDTLQREIAEERRYHETQLKAVKEDYFQYRGALTHEFQAVSASALHWNRHRKDSGDHDDTSSVTGSDDQDLTGAQELAIELAEAHKSADSHVVRYNTIQQQHTQLKVDYKVAQSSLAEQTKTAVRYKRSLEAAEAKLRRYEKLLDRQKEMLAEKSEKELRRAVTLPPPIARRK